MENSVEKNNVNRVSKSLKLKIKVYRCYDDHEAPSSSNTTVYLSWLLHLEDVLGGKVHSWSVFSREHEKLWSSQC